MFKADDGELGVKSPQGNLDVDFQSPLVVAVSVNGHRRVFSSELYQGAGRYNENT